MKLRKDFINTIISDRTTNAGQWQLQIERIQSSYAFITELLQKEQTLSAEETTRCQEFQEQLIYMLAQFIRDMDALEDNVSASHSETKALLDRHIQRMSELNEHIHAFADSLRPPTPPV